MTMLLTRKPPPDRSAHELSCQRSDECLGEGLTTNIMMKTKG
jgi:hypothetical protein